MPIKARANHGAVKHIERRKQGRGSVPNIVVGHRSTTTLFNRKPRLSSIQGLDLGFFVYAQNQRFIRRIEIQPNHIREFLNKLLVARQLEIADSMRLQTVAIPDPGHRHMTDAKFVGQGTAAPMSGILGLGMKSSVNDGLYLIFLGALRTDLSRRFVFQTGQASFQKMVAPKDDGGSAGS